MKLNLQIKAELVNVTDLQPNNSDWHWHFKAQCTMCREIHPNTVTMNLEEQIDLPNSRGSANLVMKCKFCSRDGSASFDESIKLKPYSFDNNNQFQTICTVECRNLELIGFEFRDGFTAKGLNSNLLFEDIDLTDGEWADYDDKANQEVSIMDIEARFVKA